MNITLELPHTLAVQFAVDKLNPITQPSKLLESFIKEINQNNVRTLNEFEVIFIDGSEAIFSFDKPTFISVYDKQSDIYISYKDGFKV